MSTAITAPANSALSTSLNDFDSLTESSGFLKRVQLYSKGDAVNNRLIGVGEYGIPLSGNKIQKIGDSMDVIVLARRLKALDMSDKDAIVTSYDRQSDEFKRIMAVADSGVQLSGCMYGVSFLLLERTTGWFVEYFFSSKSTRPIAAEVYGFLPCSQAEYDARKEKGEDVSGLKVQGPQAATFKVEPVKNKKGSWLVPSIHPCSTPFTKVPAQSRIDAEVAKFLTEKGNNVEKVADEPGTKKRVR